MKAVICVEHDANVAKVDPKYRKKLVPIRRKNPDGSPKLEWRWPVGLEIEGDHAPRLVRYGLARPTDEECAAACGLSEEQMRVAVEDQQMAQLGIHSKADQELFRMGVIKGFKPKAGGGVEYDWGPSAEAYKAAISEVEADKESE